MLGCPKVRPEIQPGEKSLLAAFVSERTVQIISRPLLDQHLLNFSPQDGPVIIQGPPNLLFTCLHLTTELAICFARECSGNHPVISPICGFSALFQASLHSHLLVICCVSLIREIFPPKL